MRFDEIYEGLLQGKKYRIKEWTSREYIYYDKNRREIITETGVEYNLAATQIMESDWVEYVESIDYDKCIGCLCRFWNNLSTISESKTIGILTYYNPMADYKYTNGLGLSFLHCEPIKPKEIKFYGGNND